MLRGSLYIADRMSQHAVGIRAHDLVNLNHSASDVHDPLSTESNLAPNDSVVIWRMFEPYAFINVELQNTRECSHTGCKTASTGWSRFSHEPEETLVSAVYSFGWRNQAIALRIPRLRTNAHACIALTSVP